MGFKVNELLNNKALNKALDQTELMLPALTTNEKKLLSNVRAVVVGCGAIGSETVRLLVKYGVKDFVLVDFDVVEKRNIANTWFTDSDVGELKTLALAKKLRALGCKAETFNTVLTSESYNKLLEIINVRENSDSSENSDRFEDYDNSENSENSDKVLFLDCVDNIDTKLLLNDIALKHGFLLIHSAVANNIAQSMVVVRGSCLNCLYNKKIGLSCDEGLIPSTVSIASALQSWLAVNSLLGLKLGFRVEPFLYRFNISSMRFERLRIGVKDCSSCNGLFNALKKKDFIITMCSSRGGLRLLFKQPFDMDVLKKNFKVLSTAGRLAAVFKVDINSKSLEFIAYKNGELLIKNIYDFETAKTLGYMINELISNRSVNNG